MNDLERYAIGVMRESLMWKCKGEVRGEHECGFGVGWHWKVD